MSDIDGYRDQFGCSQCKRRTDAWQYIGNDIWCGECMRDEIARLRTRSAGTASTDFRDALVDNCARVCDSLAQYWLGRASFKRGKALQDAAVRIRASAHEWATLWEKNTDYMPFPQPPREFAQSARTSTAEARYEWLRVRGCAIDGTDAQRDGLVRRCINLDEEIDAEMAKENATDATTDSRADKQ